MSEDDPKDFFTQPKFAFDLGKPPQEPGHSDDPRGEIRSGKDVHAPEIFKKIERSAEVWAPFVPTEGNLARTAQDKDIDVVKPDKA